MVSSWRLPALYLGFEILDFFFIAFNQSRGTSATTVSKRYTTERFLLPSLVKCTYLHRFHILMIL